jgi:non-specific serine/threonine protein kinase
VTDAQSPSPDAAGPLDRRRSGNLPAQITTFVGRTGLLDDVCERLGGHARLTTLTGTSGVGKTRVALKIGERMRDLNAFRHGVWLVSLAELEDPELLPRTVAQALGIVDNTRSESGLGRLVEALRNKHALLILDNCEHLLDAVQRLVRVLLQGCEDLVVLATSQERLNIAGEHVIKVPPLFVSAELPDPARSPEQTHEAVRLLIDRATAVGTKITEQDLPAAVELCTLLDGLPLAIELAAGRLAELTLSEVLEQLRDRPTHAADLDGRFELLIDGDPAGKRAHQALSWALEWSASLCSPEEKLLWQAVSVFPTDFDRTAVEAVCRIHGIAEHDVLSLLTGLARKSILIMHTSPTSRRTRYRMLSTIRLFGAQSLNDERRLDLQKAHADYFQALLQAATRDAFSSCEVLWMRTLREEWANVRAAITFNLAHADRVELGGEMAVNCGRTRFGVFGGFMGQHRQLLESAYRSLADRHDPPGMMTALHCALYCAWLAFIQGDPDVGVIWLGHARAAADRLGVRDHTMLRFVEACQTFLNEREPERGRPSVTQLDQAAEQSRRDGYPGDTYIISLFGAIAAVYHGDRAMAAAAVTEHVEWVERHDAEWSISWSLWLRGLFELVHGGDYYEAYRLGQRALAMQQDMDDRWGPAWSVWLLANVAAHLGLHELSARLFGAAKRRQDANSTSIVGLPSWHRVQEQAEQLAREGLGADEFKVQVTVAVGMRQDEAVALALAELPGTIDTQTAEDQDLALPGGLTERQLEIAALVAEGLTSERIGERLFISKRTADHHVANIRTKLGLPNKAAVGSWYEQQARRPVAG